MTGFYLGELTAMAFPCKLAWISEITSTKTSTDVGMKRIENIENEVIPLFTSLCALSPS